MKLPAWIPTENELLRQLVIAAAVAGAFYLARRAWNNRTTT